MPTFPHLHPAAAAAIALLAGALALPSPARAAAPGDELVDLINAYRAAPAGCGGRPPAPALVPETALSQVQVHSGTFLESALRSLGYRADRAEAMSLTGPQDARAAMELLQQKYCAKLLDPGLSAIGSARSGNAWQIVLAHPLAMPVLPDWEEAGRQILDGVNRARATVRTCGTQRFGAAPPVTWNRQLGLAALGHSSNMAEGHYFSHQEKNGSQPADRATRAGYPWRLVGENIASGNRTPQEAVQAWLDSPGHCANIMNPGFTEMGAAYAINPQNENHTPYWTQVFARPR
jgi:uncharacterized protein YkwD